MPEKASAPTLRKLYKKRPERAQTFKTTSLSPIIAKESS
jgi:hypothetical protein